MTTRPAMPRLLFGTVAGLCAATALGQAPPARVPAAANPAVRPSQESLGGNESIDFTPRRAELIIDDVATPVTLFSRGPNRIAVQPPPGWIAAGSASEFYLNATEFPQARITLRRSALPRPAELNPTWAQETLGLIMRPLPADSRRVVRDQRPMPIGLNGWKSYEISVAFDQFGGRFVRGYIFILTGRGELYELVTGAREQDYDAARAAAFGILTSWQEMTPALFAHLRSKRDAAGEMPSPAPR